MLAVPALIFSGLFDRWIAAGGGAVAAFAGSPRGGARRRSRRRTPRLEVGLRFLVVFAFLQTMHYVVWIAFLPRYAPDAARAFDDPGAVAARPAALAVAASASARCSRCCSWPTTRRAG